MISIYTWHKIEGLSFSGMEERTLLEKTVAEKKIGLLRKDNVVYAFAAMCPHAGTPLCSGWLDARGHIVCPNHKYRFDPANGRNTSGEGYKLFTYPIEIRNDEIFVGIQNS